MPPRSSHSNSSPLRQARLPGSLRFESSPRRHALIRRGFTLIELLIVVGLISFLMVLVGPAFTGLKNANDLTEAAYQVKGVLERARAYAKAANTYTWVGFFEENAAVPSRTPAIAGNGRLVISVVASKDGTNIYGSAIGVIDPTRLIQVDKIIRIENVHLPLFAIGTGTGDTFDTRPVLQLDPTAGCNYGRFGELNGVVPNTAPYTTPYSFQYPVGDPTPIAQYLFSKLFQFNPRGEGRVNGDSYELRLVVEIGLIQTHGAAVPNPVSGAGTSAAVYSGNVAAVQIGGIAGNVMIFRR
jgi:prepilin-type N-terminal cleavage/methylation domain-containing protein